LDRPLAFFFEPGHSVPIPGLERTAFGLVLLTSWDTASLPFLIKCLVDIIFPRFAPAFVALLVCFGLLVVQFSGWWTSIELAIEEAQDIRPSAREVPEFCMGADCIIEFQYEFITWFAN
jgi:hypothetical protein